MGFFIFMRDFRDRVSGVLRRCTKTFGELVTYYPRSGGSYAITAIFDNDVELVDPETEQVITSNQSRIGVNLSKINFELKVTDQVQVRNIRYKVVEVKEDGQGGAELYLNKVKHDKKVNKKKDSTGS